MGTWKLEVAKMALYISFPIGLFHYFNQPEYFEEWVVKTKRELYPPDNPARRQEFEDTINKIREKQQQSEVASFENNGK